MFPGWLQGFFQDDHFKWKIQRNSMIPNYSMIPAIRWSPAIWWPPAIWRSIGTKDFDNPKVHGDTSITDGLVFAFSIQSRWMCASVNREISRFHILEPMFSFVGPVKGTGNPGNHKLFIYSRASPQSLGSWNSLFKTQVSLYQRQGK